jgi:lysyl-tRNA synthetase class 2
MLALPDKYHGLEDIEIRYRQRYADLFTNPEVRDVFVKRAHILRSVRHFFDSHGYLEVETPMLHTIAGGATARTFTTHHNAEDMELTLRIAPELHLKRLVVGGLDRVYEINRNFRNEGIDRTHNPEFTMLEFYQAYANYHDLMKLTKELIAQVAQDVNGTPRTTFNDVEIDLAPENWQQLSMREAIIKFWRPSFENAPGSGDFMDKLAFIDVLTRAMQGAQSELMATESIEDLGVRTSERKMAFDRFDAIQKNRRALLIEGGELGKSIAELFETLAEPHLIQPTIIYDYPLAVSPLSKPKPDEPDWVERFEFYIGGFELGNGFSELNDPDDQLRRFEAQLEDRKRGDAEAMAEIDYDYVRALGYGLPPTAGEGIGIDRLTMVLTGSRTIRDVMLFPLMRPQKPSTDLIPEPTQSHGESAE